MHTKLWGICNYNCSFWFIGLISLLSYLCKSPVQRSQWPLFITFHQEKKPDNCRKAEREITFVSWWDENFTTLLFISIFAFVIPAKNAVVWNTSVLFNVKPMLLFLFLKVKFMVLHVLFHVCAKIHYFLRLYTLLENLLHVTHIHFHVS